MATQKALPAKNVDEYIAGFSEDIQQKLQAVRAAIHKAVPEAKETIKYAIPTFTLNGNVISFGAWKNHIGIYPVPRQAKEFKKELSKYAGEKNTMQLPYESYIPFNLIAQMVKYRVLQMNK